MFFHLSQRRIQNQSIVAKYFKMWNIWVTTIHCNWNLFSCSAYSQHQNTCTRGHLNYPTQVFGLIMYQLFVSVTYNLFAIIRHINFRPQNYVFSLQFHKFGLKINFGIPGRQQCTIWNGVYCWEAVRLNSNSDMEIKIACA